MQPPNTTIHLLGRLWHHISPRRRAQFALLFILMVLASFAEIVSIGAVLPFLGMLTAPERVFEHPILQSFSKALGITSAEQLLLPITLGFCLAALLAGATRLLLLWANTRLSFATGADLSIEVYRRTLYQPYAIHIARNSSEVIAGIASKTQGVIYHIILPTLTIISASLMLVIVLVALLSIDPLIALAAFGGFGLIYAFIIRITHSRLSIDGHLTNQAYAEVIKCLQEGLGGIRDILIDGSQATYTEIYRKADQPLRRGQGNLTFIGQSPRYAMEALGMLLIASLAYALAKQSDGIAKAIPVLGALVVGAQRLLPILQQAYAAWSNIKAGKALLQDALKLLDQPIPDYVDRPSTTPLPFTQQIRLKQLSFRYSPQTPWVLKNLDLTVTKGSRIGIVGATGSGKSTLLDIVMGLLQATEGVLEVDGEPITAGNNRAWQAHIAHVPQAIFLSDSSIESNIAFGIPKDQIDPERVRSAARQAQIADVIEGWPDQYKTVVGERGIRLSGGQRQRIGIARALYKKANVIIFDEATSALDNETEKAVMQAIEDLNKDLTILIIAHRLSTLRNCTQIVELGNGRIRRSGVYQDFESPVAMRT